MTKILELLKFLPVLISGIMGLIKVFEVPGSGKDKKAAVLEMVGLIFGLLETLKISLPIEKDKVLEFTGKAIDVLVVFLNAVKVFKHKEINPT